MNKTLTFILKLFAMLAILGFVGWSLHNAWNAVSGQHLQVDWRFGILGVVSFGATLLTSGLTWRWLAWRMGDRNPTIPLLGAYTCSQLGKYIPGKVVLLLMRVERSGRVGMEPRICVVATLIENAMYMVSGGLVALVTLLLNLRDKPLFSVAVGGGMIAMLALFHPRIFYWLVDKALVKMKQLPLGREQRLKPATLFVAVLLFLPCWIFGGISLWCAARSITIITAGHFATLPGGYALGVTGGMASLLPGGFGPNEGIKSLFLSPIIGGKLAIIAVGVQRLLQVVAELILGVAGVLLTAARPRETSPAADTPLETSDPLAM